MKVHAKVQTRVMLQKLKSKSWRVFFFLPPDHQGGLFSDRWRVTKREKGLSETAAHVGAGLSGEEIVSPARGKEDHRRACCGIRRHGQSWTRVSSGDRSVVQGKLGPRPQGRDAMDLTRMAAGAGSAATGRRAAGSWADENARALYRPLHSDEQV